MVLVEYIGYYHLPYETPLILAAAENGSKSGKKRGKEIETLLVQRAVRQFKQRAIGVDPKMVTVDVKTFDDSGDSRFLVVGEEKFATGTMRRRSVSGGYVNKVDNVAAAPAAAHLDSCKENRELFCCVRSSNLILSTRVDSLFTFVELSRCSHCTEASNGPAARGPSTAPLGLVIAHVFNCKDGKLAKSLVVLAEEFAGRKVRRLTSVSTGTLLYSTSISQAEHRHSLDPQTLVSSQKSPTKTTDDRKHDDTISHSSCGTSDGVSITSQVSIPPSPTSLASGSSCSEFSRSGSHFDDTTVVPQVGESDDCATPVEQLSNDEESGEDVSLPAIESGRSTLRRQSAVRRRSSNVKPEIITTAVRHSSPSHLDDIPGSLDTTQDLDASFPSTWPAFGGPGVAGSVDNDGGYLTRSHGIETLQLPSAFSPGGSRRGTAQSENLFAKDYYAIKEVGGQQQEQYIIGTPAHLLQFLSWFFTLEAWKPCQCNQ